MKILRITLKNIASLSGLHTVDFTREPLRSAGLFSISGQTGSGKSTLLDCLCLALYDQTPRLHSVGRSVELPDGESQSDTRTLLRRGAGLGMVEVAFVGVDGLEWTARWEVRRSRGLSDGKLQQVQMTLFRTHIAPGAEGVIEQGGKKTLVLDAIQDKIGLTFHQFTRAVLLAQNDFATFLKASDKDRAEILQALTGTQHYESISRAVYERCQRENQAVTTARQVLDASPPLSLEARAQAESASTQETEELERLTGAWKTRQTHADWFHALTKLEERSKAAESQHRQAEEQVQAAAARRLDLKHTEILTRQAQPLRAAQQQAMERSLQADVACQEALIASKDCEKALEDAGQALDQAQRHLEGQQAAAEQLRQQIIAARELDSQLAPLEERYDQARVAADDGEREYLTAENRLKARLAEQADLAEKLKALEQDYASLRIYEPFVADAGLWRERIGRAITQDRDLQALRERLLQEQEVWEHAVGQIDSWRETMVAQQIACQDSESRWQAAKGSVETFDIEYWDAQRDRCGELLKTLNRWKVQFVESSKLREEQIDAATERKQLAEAHAGEEARQRAIHQMDLPNAEVALSTGQQQLQRMKDTLDDHAIRFRHALRDGEACPVCGATEHPYAAAAPQLESIALRAAEQHVHELQQARDDLKTTAAGLQSLCQQRTEQIAKISKELERLGNRLKEFAFDAADQPDIAAILALPPDEQLAAATTRCDEIESQTKEIAKRLKRQRDAMSQVDASRKQMDEQRDALRKLERERDKSEEKAELSRKELEHCTQLVLAAEQNKTAAEQEMLALWSAWPTARDEYKNEPDAFLQRFRAGTDKCNQLQREREDVKGQLQTIAVALVGLREQLESAERIKIQRTDSLQKAKEDVDRVRSQRGLLLDGRPISAVEAELGQVIELADKACKKMQFAWGEADKQLALANKKLQDCTENAATARSGLSIATRNLTEWLDDFCRTHACMLTLDELDERLGRDPHWLECERDALDRLDDAVKETFGAWQAHQLNVTMHLEQRLTSDPMEKVLEEVAALSKACEEARERSERARAVVNRDDELRRANSERLSHLEQLERQARPWQQLNELIGSADGAKFRMIAQRRTLDLLLGYSNQQLRQLAPRYRLERLSESLNLIVIDCDMGDERRSIHSLSGGESFLVSLALALGLASLTSDRVRVESLFIDEGFGSLDPETLNVAMGALMQLESQGRKVGVISHVQEMTDAIPVQIVVQKGRGGSSRIVIPGGSSHSDAADPIDSIAAPALTDTSHAAADGERQMDPWAAALKAILERERQAGRAKVSTRALREELGCTTSEFKAAQSALGDQVMAEGRSLQLRDRDAK